MIKNPKIIFMGTPEISVIVLRELIDSGIVVGCVVTRPDKKRGRGSGVTKSPAKICAESYCVPTFEPKSKLELEEFIKDQKPDIILVAAFGMILPKSVLETPKYGAINIHPSILPKYRGPAPIQAPIINGDDKTGVCLMMMSEGMDEGDIIDVYEMGLTGKETAQDLGEVLARKGAGLFVKNYKDITSGNLHPIPQKSTGVSYTKFFGKDMGHIKFKEMAAEEIERLSRALLPWPGIYTFYDNKKIELFDASLSPEKIEPGKIVCQKDSVVIGTKNYSISFKGIKAEGKRKMTASEYLCGQKDFGIYELD
jgi:methionyl-tRNA formyltransferase